MQFNLISNSSGFEVRWRGWEKIYSSRTK